MIEHIDDHMLYNNPLVKLSLKPPLWRIFLAINGRQIILILSLFLAFASSSTVNAEQWLFDEPLRWDAHFIFDGSWRDSETNAGNSYSSESIRYRERFSFKKRLYILDPAILRLDFHASPTFSQSSFLDANNTTDESDSVSWDYSANSSLFHGARTPLSLTAGIGNTTGVSNGILGARTDFEMKNQQVTARLKNRFFPSLISYTTRDQDQTLKTNFSATPWRTNDSIKRLSYAGRSSKMNLNIEQVDYNDYIYGRNYRYNSERLTHAFKWGKKSSLHSRLEHREQNGLGDYQQTSITENVRLQHTQQLFSSYMYAYDKTEQNSDKTSHRSSIDINHTLYTNLTTQAGYSQNLDRYSTGGKASTTGPNYSVSYNKKLPMKKSNISLGFNGARISTEQVGGTQLIDVINDANIFVADRIILSQQYIDISTIQVFNSTTGAPYDENTDYTITQAASGFTEIYRVISGGIIPDEDVNVNFSRWVPGNVSRRNAYFFRFSIDNLQLYYNQTKNNQSLNLGSANVTVPSNFSPETQSNVSLIGLSYNLRKQKFNLGLSIESGHTNLNNYDLRSLSFKQSLSYNFSPLVSLKVSADEGSIKTSLSNVSSVNANASLDIRVPWSRMTVKPHLSFRQQDDSVGGNNNRFLAEGVDFEWRYHLITFTASLDHMQWSGTSSNSDDLRLMFNLIRRSR